jgi:putative Holliday junction resolvase
MHTGRILALDYGLKRVGLAISDPARTMAFPREVLLNQGEKGLIDLLVAYCLDQQVNLVLVGVPFNDDHSDTKMTSVIRHFITALSHALKEINVQVLERDEKFTTAQARELMENVGIDREKQRDYKDVFAAMIILQEYLGIL